MAQLQWGILGTGFIAGTVAQAINAVDNNRIYAVGSRSQHSADQFAKQHRVAQAYDNYQAVLDNPNVDIVYITLPNKLHKEWIIRAAQAGKHILCEKPFTMDTNEAAQAFAAVESAGVFCMEAYMYRCHPQTQKIIELINGGQLGEVHLINSYFNVDLSEASSIHLDRHLGGGAIMDMGGYCISLAMLVAQTANGSTTIMTPSLQASGSLNAQSGVDAYASALLQFSQPLTACLHTSSCYGFTQYAQIIGSKARLTITQPFLPSENELLTLENYNDGKTTISIITDNSLLFLKTLLILIC